MSAINAKMIEANYWADLIKESGWPKEVWLYPESARPIQSQSFRTSQASVSVGEDWTDVATISCGDNEYARLLQIGAQASESADDFDTTWRLILQPKTETQGLNGTPSKQNPHIAEIRGPWGQLTNLETLVFHIGQNYELVLQARADSGSHSVRAVLSGWRAMHSKACAVSQGFIKP